MAKFLDSTEETTLKTLVDSNLFTDITLKVGENSIKAHKLILAAKSVYFNNLLSKNKNKNVFKFDHMELPVLQAVVDHIYSRRIDLKIVDSRKLFTAAKEFESSELIRICRDDFSQNVCSDNVFEILDIVKEKTLIDLSNLKEKCFGIIQANYEEIFKTPEWNNFLEKNVSLVNEFTLRLQKEAYPIVQNLGKVREKLSKPPNSGSQVKSFMKDIIKSQQFSDVVLESNDGKTIEAHKVILSNRSEVFKAMFTNDTLEAKENRVKFGDMDFETLQTFFNFIYFNEVDELKKLALALLLIAEQYNMTDLKRTCEYHLSKNISEENVIEVLIAIHNFDFINPFIKKAARSFLSKSLEKFIDKPEWINFVQKDHEIFSGILQEWIQMIKEDGSVAVREISCRVDYRPIRLDSISVPSLVDGETKMILGLLGSADKKKKYQKH